MSHNNKSIKARFLGSGLLVCLWLGSTYLGEIERGGTKAAYREISHRIFLSDRITDIKIMQENTKTRCSIRI